MDLPIAFDWELEHGRCVGIRLPELDEAACERMGGFVPDEERALGLSYGVRRRHSWLAGRIALRFAASRLGIELPPIVANDRGAPVLPVGLVGSISHKEELAVAICASDSARTRGVDVEQVSPHRDVARVVLTEHERETLAGLEESAKAIEVLLRFSIKEAIYKAIDPYMRRYVGFHEVEVTPDASGAVAIHPLFKSPEPLSIEARYRRHEDWFVSTAWASKLQ